MNRFRYLIFFLSFILIACTSLVNSKTSLAESFLPVTLVNLINSPEKYERNNLKIVVSGYLASRANLYLFLSKEHAMLDDFASSVPLRLDSSDWSLTSSECLDKFVSLIGTFEKDFSGNYVISRITKVQFAAENWGKHTCWEKDN